jgi:hypothetical protein
MAGVTMLGILASGPLVESCSPALAQVPEGRTDRRPDPGMFPYLYWCPSRRSPGHPDTFTSRPRRFSPVLLSVANIPPWSFFHSWFRIPPGPWPWIPGRGSCNWPSVPFLRKQGITFRRDGGDPGPGGLQVPGSCSPGLLGGHLPDQRTTPRSSRPPGPGFRRVAQYARRLQELVLGVFAGSVATVLLPTRSDRCTAEWSDVKATCGVSVKSARLRDLPAHVGLIQLGNPDRPVPVQYGRFDDTPRHDGLALQLHAAGSSSALRGTWSSLLRDARSADADVVAAGDAVPRGSSWVFRGPSPGGSPWRVPGGALNVAMLWAPRRRSADGIRAILRPREDIGRERWAWAWSSGP